MLHVSEKNGFTLIETLIAVLFLTIAISPALALAVSSSRLAGRIQNNLIATELAQEGIEVVRNMRDNNWLAGVAFNTNIATGVYSPTWDSTTLNNANNANFLKIDSNGFYNYSSGTDTIFKRTVSATRILSTNGIRLVSTVTWPERKTLTRSVSVEEILTNWR